MSSRRAAWASAALFACAVGALWAGALRSGPQDERRRETRVGSPAAGVESSAEVATAGCDHPYVPTAPGTELVYRWAGQHGSGEVAMRLLGIDEPRGSWTARWRCRSEGAGGARTWHMDRACDATGAQEPWLGLTGNDVLELRGQTWRVPRVLNPGDAFAGSFVAAAAGLEVTMARSHRVASPERVSVEAGTFEALRVEVEERAPRGAEPAVSVQWLAPGPGLVRMEQGVGSAALLYELVEWTAN